MVLYTKTYKHEWDNGMTMKLFIKFLKLHHCMHNFYTALEEETFFYPSYEGVGKMFLRYGNIVYPNLNNNNKNELVLSQLWRFYVLERLNEYPKDTRNVIKIKLEQQLVNNGERGNQELKELFEKYKIIPRY